MDLKNRTILVTRPEPESEETARQIRACNGHPFCLPALKILPPYDPMPLRHALTQWQNDGYHGYDGIILTSVNSVRALLANLPNFNPQTFSSNLFPVGPKTAHALAVHQFVFQQPKPPFHAEHLAQQIVSRYKLPARFLFLRAEQGRDVLKTYLERAGFEVDLITAYRVKPIDNVPEEILDALRAHRIDALTFFSAHTARAFLEALPPTSSAASWIDGCVTAVISASTADVLRTFGVTATCIAKEHTGEALLKSLADYWR